jgi:glycosyltransferase involved in cell wall biosynthesis
MKIVIAVEEFDPVKRYLEYYLAKELTSLGHKVYILTFGSCKGSSRAIPKEGFEVLNIPHFVVINGYHLPNLLGVNYLFKFIKLERPDIIHCQSLDSPLSLIFVAWKGFFNYKIVGSVVTQLNLVFSPWDAKKKMMFFLSKIVVASCIAKKSATIFAKNRELAKLISRSYNIAQKKFCIIPLGSDPELFKFNSKARILVRKKLGLSETNVLLVYSGKLDSSKGLDVLIRALAPIATRNDKVKLLIIGEGLLSFTQYLNRLISKLKIEDKVIFYPWIKQILLPSFYSASDIGVWPGLSSISIVDAVSTGLPVVIAHYPVETYAIENQNGLTFEIGNVKELHNCLDCLIRDDRLRKIMGYRSRRLVEQNLNWKKITLQYLYAYTSALNKG